MIYIESPAVYSGDNKAVFLAGGISNCPDWQQEMKRMLTPSDLVLFNPRAGNHDNLALNRRKDDKSFSWSGSTVYPISEPPPTNDTVQVTCSFVAVSSHQDIDPEQLDNVRQAISKAFEQNLQDSLDDALGLWPDAVVYEPPRPWDFPFKIRLFGGW